MMEKIEYWLTLPIIQIGDFSLRLSDLASAMGIIIVTMIASRVLTRAATVAGKRSRAKDQNIYVINRVLKYLVYALGIFMALFLVFLLIILQLYNKSLILEGINVNWNGLGLG